MKTDSQKQRIINLLSDFQVHCLSHEMYIKDDRSRISELRHAGYVFDEDLGTCKDLTHHHGADLKLRKLISVPFTETKKTVYRTKQFCCIGYWKTKVHDLKCYKLKQIEIEKTTANPSQSSTLF